jgi:hypothetical protein
MTILIHFFVKISLSKNLNKPGKKHLTRKNQPFLQKNFEVYSSSYGESIKLRNSKKKIEIGP